MNLFDEFDKGDVIAIFLALVAIALQIRSSLISKRRFRDDVKLKQALQENAWVKEVGPFPENLEHIADLVDPMETPKKELLIACDVLLFGLVSCYGSCHRYRKNLQKTLMDIDPHVPVRIVVYDKSMMRQCLHDQFEEYTDRHIIDFLQASEYFKSKRHRTSVLETLARIDSKEMFIDHIIEMNEKAIEDLQRNYHGQNLKIYRCKEELPVYLWCVDEENGVKTIPFYKDIFGVPTHVVTGSKTHLRMERVRILNVIQSMEIEGQLNDEGITIERKPELE